MTESTPAGLPGRGDEERPPTDAWYERWVERVAAEDLPMPVEEAHHVLRAVLSVLDGAPEEALDRSARAWGRAHRSVSVLVRRLSGLREAFTAWGFGDPIRTHRALDRLTAGATEEVVRRLEHASRTDPLTGVGNRRAFEETLAAALSAATRQGHQITVVEVDLDGLKRINDETGHAAGDAALLALVRAFYAALRDEDTVFRVGGDEFMILLPFTSAETAAILMDRIAAADAPPFTWGASGFPGGAADARALVEAADRDLYARRGLRRAPAPAGAADAALAASSRRHRGRPVWIPAAAAAAVGVAAALTTLSLGAGGHATPQALRHGVVTKPSHGSTTPSPSATPATGPTSTAVVGAFPVVPVSFRTSLADGTVVGTGGTSVTAGGSGPGGAGGGTPGAPGGPGGSPTPAATGGALGALTSLTSPVPLVGGPGGLVADLARLLTGSPTIAAADVAGGSGGAGPGAATGLGG